MGLLGWFSRKKALTASPSVVEAAAAGRLSPYPSLGGTNANAQIKAAWLTSQSASYAYLYAHQPAVRRVIDYIASNMAQLGLKLYERVSDTEREPREDHPAAQSLAYPNELGPADQFIFDYVADYLVHDNAYALKLRNGNLRTFLWIPAPAIAVNSDGRFTINSYRIYRADGTYFDVGPEDVMHWRGYNPDDPRIGVSKLETLRLVLTEDATSQAASIELMKAGLSKPGYITRPLDAPEWTEDARKRFQTSWANQGKANPRLTPVLEEGMEFADFGVSPKDAEMLDGRRFTNEEVASLYGMPAAPPEDEEDRKQFYADVLAPLTRELACQLDFSVLRQEYSSPDLYFEFNLNEKLRGDFETRSAALTATTGRPWRTVNEARAIENLPAIEGGDELTIPLNIALASDYEAQQQSPQLPAPNVMPPQDPNKPPADGSYRENNGGPPELKQLPPRTGKPRRIADMARQRRAIDRAHAMLDRYYRRQGSALAGKGLKAAANTERWNRELADDINGVAHRITENEGGIYVAHLGGDSFDMSQVENYLKSTSEGIAEAINQVTENEIAEFGLEEAMKRAKNVHAAIAAAGIGSRVTVFARREAAKQSPNPASRVQTWIANTARHSELDGVSVSLNGDWGGIEPGTEPNCACSASIT